MRVLEYIHATLIAMLVIPLLYALAELRDADGTVMLYIKCMLIILPIAATQIAVTRIKSLGIYLISGLAVTAAMWGIMHLLFDGSGLCYTAVMLAESLFIVMIRFRERLRLARQKREDDIYTAPQISLINKPSLGFMWYFAVMYAIGIIFNAKTLCDIAFVNAAIYFFTAFAHMYVTATNHYLRLNKRTKSIPRKRLYAISGAMAGAFAALVFIAMLPSFFLADQRRYTDIRTWFDDVQNGPYVIEYQVQPDAGEAGDWIEMINEGEPPREPSKLWGYLGWFFVAVCAVFMTYEAVKLLKQVFRDFRNSYDENGDRVEELDDEPSQKEERLGLRRRMRSDSEAERIRRAYRRTIRRHRREIPAPYESPAELEENAGLSEDEAMKELHVKYEHVRYGREE